MTERGPIFDAAREAYEAAQTLLADLINNPQAGGTVDEYRAMLTLAQRVSNDAHRKMMEAWG